jgi:hypothetical protein
MRVHIRGHRLPGLTCGSYTNIHVGLQVRREPVGLVPADAAAAEWVTEISAVDGDFRGPAVQGRKGARFLYLTWGTGAGESFSMFRRAKLMLADLPADANESPSRSISPTSTACPAAPACARLRSGSADHARTRGTGPSAAGRRGGTTLSSRQNRMSRSAAWARVPRAVRQTSHVLCGQAAVWLWWLQAVCSL